MMTLSLAGLHLSSGNRMAKWNSIPLEITYQTLGWIAFVSWSIGFYPQLILNFQRRRVVGLSFDFVVSNLRSIDKMIPVAANDVAFSIHAVFVTAITLFQIVIYDRGDQKVSKITIAVVCIVWLAAGVCFLIALPSHSWLWLISIFNSIQVLTTVIKYIPQAAMSFMRKSTDGFSIGFVLLDFLGGVANYAQMAVQSIDQKSWVNFYGNAGKVLLSLVVMFFDLLFMCQHFILYRGKGAVISSKLNKDVAEPLIRSSEDPELGNIQHGCGKIDDVAKSLDQGNKRGFDKDAVHQGFTDAQESQGDGGTDVHDNGQLKVGDSSLQSFSKDCLERGDGFRIGEEVGLPGADQLDQNNYSSKVEVSNDYLDRGSGFCLDESEACKDQGTAHSPPTTADSETGDSSSFLDILEDVDHGTELLNYLRNGEKNVSELNADSEVATHTGGQSVSIVSGRNNQE